MTSLSAAESSFTRPQLYGDPESGIPPEALYARDDALDALRKARFSLEHCESLLAGE